MRSGSLDWVCGPVLAASPLSVSGGIPAQAWQVGVLTCSLEPHLTPQVVQQQEDRAASISQKLLVIWKGQGSA